MSTQHIRCAHYISRHMSACSSRIEGNLSPELGALLPTREDTAKTNRRKEGTPRWCCRKGGGSARALPQEMPFMREHLRLEGKKADNLRAGASLAQIAPRSAAHSTASYPSLASVFSCPTALVRSLLLSPRQGNIWHGFENWFDMRERFETLGYCLHRTCARFRNFQSH